MITITPYFSRPSVKKYIPLTIFEFIKLFYKFKTISKFLNPKLSNTIRTSWYELSVTNLPVHNFIEFFII